MLYENSPWKLRTNLIGFWWHSENNLHRLNGRNKNYVSKETEAGDWWEVSNSSTAESAGFCKSPQPARPRRAWSQATLRPLEGLAGRTPPQTPPRPPARSVPRLTCPAGRPHRRTPPAGQCEGWPGAGRTGLSHAARTVKKIKDSDTFPMVTAAQASVTDQTFSRTDDY